MNGDAALPKTFIGIFCVFGMFCQSVGERGKGGKKDGRGGRNNFKIANGGYPRSCFKI